HFIHSPAAASSEDHSIQQQVPRARGLVEIHVTSPAVVRSEMENHADAFHRPLRDTKLSEVRLNELHPTLVHQAANILHLAAREVVHNADLGSALCQGIHKARANERGSAGDQNPEIIPAHRHSPWFQEIGEVPSRAKIPEPRLWRGGSSPPPARGLAPAPALIPPWMPGRPDLPRPRSRP